MGGGSRGESPERSETPPKDRAVAWEVEDFELSLQICVRNFRYGYSEFCFFYIVIFAYQFSEAARVWSRTNALDSSHPLLINRTVYREVCISSPSLVFEGSQWLGAWVGTRELELRWGIWDGWLVWWWVAQ